MGKKLDSLPRGLEGHEGDGPCQRGAGAVCDITVPRPRQGEGCKHADQAARARGATGSWSDGLKELTEVDLRCLPEVSAREG